MNFEKDHNCIYNDADEYDSDIGNGMDEYSSDSDIGNGMDEYSRDIDNGKVFFSADDFRNRATAQDIKDLGHYYETQHNKSQAFKDNAIYRFSATTAKKLLIVYGYFTATKTEIKPPTEAKPAFAILGDREPYIAKSLDLKKSVIERLDKMATTHWMYTRKAIINQLLEDALTHYGY